MFRKTRVWPVVQRADAGPIDDAIDVFFAATSVGAVRPAVEALVEISGAQPWNADKSVWKWLAAWCDRAREWGAQLTAAKILMFTNDWHEAFVRQSGTAWMSLMKATDDDLARIHRSALTACRDLPASTVVHSPDQVTIGDILARLEPNQPHQDRANGVSTAPAGAADRQAEQWLAAGESRYADLVRRHFGSPETIAAGGHQCLQAGDIAAALFFFQKSIDLLHTLYVVSGMQRRSPNRADQPIITSYVDTLDEVLGLHPQAPIAASVREVTHRLRTISTLCRDAGIDPSLYLSALNQLPTIAPDVDVRNILWRN